MKHMDIKKASRFFLFKLFALVLVTLLTVSTLCLFVGASERFAGVTWKVLDSRYQRISGDGVIYERIELPAGCEKFPLAPMYQYANSPEGYESSGSVFSTEEGGYLIGVSYYGGETYYYCREDMLSETQAYLNGESGRYVLRTPTGDTWNFRETDIFYDLSTDAAEALLSYESAEEVSCDVTLLENLPKLELRLCDKSGMLITHLGTLYCFDDGAYGFVNYQKLDNSHFDADGYFSYRQGSVILSMLNPALTKEIVASTAEGYQLRSTYEYEVAYEDDYYENMEDAFWVLIVFAGYLLPIAPLTVGLAFAHSKKMSHPKRWYVVAGLAALWLLLAVVLTVIVLI